MRLKTWISGLLLLISIHFSTIYGQSDNFELIKGMELMSQIHQHLEMYFVDEPKPGKMSKDAIDAMLRELDPYTVYYHESNMEDYRLMTTGQYGGIGSLIRRIGDYTCITEPYENSPAQKAGLMAGDRIIAVDGKSMKGLSTDEVSKSLKGPKGTDIEIEVKRGDQKVKIKVTRDQIKLPDVPYSGMLNQETGYIKLNSFTQTAGSDVKSALLQLKDQGAKSLVLDLRGNGGGLLIEAVKIVNLFVKKGQLVVNTKGRVKDENRVYKTMDNPVDLEMPLVVLVDEGSASASEIVSGCLQDLDRAVIIGETSYGKGLVQRTYNLKYGSKLKLTIAKYYTPSGRCVQKLEYYDKGVDGRVKEIPDSLIKVFKTANGRDVIDGRGIEPDIKIEEENLSRLSSMLLIHNLVFNFATDYREKHPSIANAKTFHLSNEDYESFKQTAIKDTFNYSTASEEMLKRMKETAEKEGYFADIQSEYSSLLNKVTPSKERDLDKFRDEILEMLENEIVSRYYYQKGRAEYSFRQDPYVQESIKIFKDLSAYNKILSK
ncbi:MAG: S41 family peptidase [Bacteroidetes bacterium]|nr:MAG: S41 family peptidase [Bacteroidota bacterium]